VVFLSMSFNISTRLSGLIMSCTICGHAVDTITHAILECPLAAHIWTGSGIVELLWSPKFLTVSDCPAKAPEKLTNDLFG